MLFSFARWWGPLLAYMGLIFFLSSRPIPEPLRAAPDHLLHFAGYFVFGMLAVRAFGRGLAAAATRSTIAASAVFSVAYAATDELHQGFVPGRVVSAQDLLADTFGILAAIGTLALYWHVSGRRAVVSDPVE